MKLSLTGSIGLPRWAPRVLAAAIPAAWRFFTAWFSEMITVHYGAKLVDIFDPNSEFADNWKAPEHAECERECIKLM